MSCKKQQFIVVVVADDRWCLFHFFVFQVFFLDFVSGCDVEPPVDLDKNDSSDDGLSSS